MQLLKRQHQGKKTKPYVLLDEMLAGPHNHLKEAKIAIAWRLGWRPDADNHLTLGKLRKRGDLDRELDSFDFVVLLNKEAWETLTDVQQRAVVDHELCHAGLTYDSDGEAKLDDRGRLVCRIKKHDVEEFRAVTERHGLWTADLSSLAQSAINDQQRPLLARMEGKEKAKGEKGKGSDDKIGDKTAAKTDAKPTKPAKDAWRKAPLADANITGRLAKKFAEAKITTLGQLSDLMNEHGDWWPREVAGVGEASAEAVANLFAAYWKQHPEYCG